MSHDLERVPVVLPPYTQRNGREVRSTIVTTTTPLNQWGFQTGSSALAVQSWEASDAVRLAYYQNVYVWACARAIAEDIASLAFRAGPDPDEPDEYSPSAPLAALLGPPTAKAPGGPCTQVSSKTWWEWTIVQLLIAGRFSHEKVGFGTEQPQLWPVPAQNITPLPSYQPGEWFGGFRYGAWGGPSKMLRPEDVFHYWRPSADDFRRPESVLQAARLDVSVAIMQDRYDFAFLRNDARPASIVVYEQFAKIGENDKFEGKFLADHQGVDNAGKPIFVQADPDGAPPKEAISITPLGLTQKDAEFIQRHEQKIRSIVVAFGVPMSRLGDSSNRTFSNAGQEYFNYYRKLKTITRELGDCINMEIAPLVGNEYGWFDTTPLDEAIEDAKIQAAGLTDLVKTRIIKINESRAQLGLPAVDDGDRFITDEELGLFQGAAAQILVAQQAPPPPEPPALEEKQSEPEPEPEPTVQHDENPARGDKPERVSAHIHEVRRAAAYSKRSRRVKMHEASMERRMQDILDRQLEATTSRLQGKRGRQALRAGETREPAATATDALFDQEYWIRETAKEMRTVFEAVFADSASTLLEELNTTTPFDIEDPTVQAFIQNRANQLAGHVTDTTYSDIKSALAAGTKEGESVPKLADRIRGLFEQTYKNRAETVARTEVLSAYNGSAFVTGNSLPNDVVQGFEWLATPGSRTRPSHAAANGQVIPQGAKFAVGGSELAYPGDPSAPAGLIVNCRCTLLSLTPDEYAERSTEGNKHLILSRAGHTFHSQETAIDALLSRIVTNYPPEDGWEPRGESAGHAFHGNQHTGSKGGGGSEPTIAHSQEVAGAAWSAAAETTDASSDTEGRAALQNYMEHGYDSINQSMIDGAPNAQAQAMTRLMHSKDGGTLTDDVVLDRGLSAGHFADQMKNAAEGTELEYKSFISTTSSHFEKDGDGSAAAEFTKSGDAVVMRITTRAGQRFLPGTEYENEMILPPGKLRVSRVERRTEEDQYIGTVHSTILHMDYTQS